MNERKEREGSFLHYLGKRQGREDVRLRHLKHVNELTLLLNVILSVKNKK